MDPSRWPQVSGIARDTRKTSPWAMQTTAPSVRKRMLADLGQVGLRAG